MFTLPSLFIRFFPTHCLLCHDSCKTTLPLCLTCIKHLPFLSHHCTLCSYLTGCNELITLCDYAAPINSFIIQLKFRQQLIYAHALGTLFAQSLSSYYHKKMLPEALIPVPLHPARLKIRGFNQANEIAKPIAKALSLPILYDIIYRSKDTKAQSDLPKALRQKNVNDAFTVKRPLSLSYIALIDDVITTGSTIQTIITCLKNAGVKQIDVWCLARTRCGHSSSLA